MPSTPTPQTSAAADSAAPRDIDLENVTKALHAAQFLASDLRALTASESPLLSEVALRELTDAAAMEGRLQRVVLALAQCAAASAT